MMNLNPTFCIALSILLFLLPLIRSQTAEGGIKSVSAASIICTAVVPTALVSTCNSQSTGEQVCCHTTSYDADAVATTTCSSYIPQNLPLQQYGAPLAANSKTNICGSQANGVPAVIGSNSANCISIQSPQMDYTCTQFNTSDQSCCYELLYDAAANPVRACKSFIPTGLPPAQTGLVGDPTSKTYVCNQIVPQPVGGPCINCPDYNDDEKSDPSDDKYEDCKKVQNPQNPNACTSQNDQWKNPCCFIYLPGQDVGFKSCQMNKNDQTFSTFISTMIPPGYQANCNSRSLGVLLILQCLMVVMLLI